MPVPCITSRVPVAHQHRRKPSARYTAPAVPCQLAYRREAEVLKSHLLRDRRPCIQCDRPHLLINQGAYRCSSVSLDNAEQILGFVGLWNRHRARMT